MNVRILAFLLVVIVAATVSPAPLHALESDEISLTFNWSAATYYQGDYGNVSISLKSRSIHVLKFTTVVLVFIGGYYYYFDFPLDLSLNPLIIPPEGSCVFPTIDFYIHALNPKGLMRFEVFLQVEENSTSGWSATTWVSPLYPIMVHDINEKTYYNSTRNIEEKLVQAQMANFTDSNAKSLLQQCLSEKDLASQFAQKGKWGEAVTHTETATGLLEQAISSEKLYWKGQASAALSSVRSKLNQTNLQSSEARVLLSQASSRADEAQRAYSSEDYKNATLLASSASSLLEKAVEAEGSSQTQGQQVAVIIVSSVAGVVIASTALILIRRKRNRKP